TVKRLQGFARPRSEGQLERVDFGLLLREVAKLTAPRWRSGAPESGPPISLEVAVEGDTVIDGWPGSLREALTNLVFNAADALPAGGHVRLSARRSADRVLVEVTDSGVGMTPEVQARAFEPFFS